MAARSNKPEETAPAATVRPQEYSAGTGWEVGQTAPEDAFRALDVSGSGEPTGPVVNTHPGGYARQIVTKGALVTAGVRRELDEAEQDGGA
ncbi:hypothetical protein OG402_11990 [Streptomyces anulatus]|uniref:hypothetical protein n=1 Tax=Streptomyces anulatus TaxID=1892 RepID=UPI0022511E7D|nr:hypothetical protein [Streptomyces anulatus]MCX4601209.1 hypothetical protein [Streptomyces anulatus]WSI77931.1 hypothetical protein OG557_13650 [Streptomyces anulatus]